MENITEKMSLVIARVVGVNPTDNTVSIRRVKDINHVQQLNGDHFISTTTSHKAIIRSVGVQMTTDVYAVAADKGPWFEDTGLPLDTDTGGIMERNKNAWSMFLPALSSETFKNPIYVYYCPENNSITSCFRMNDTPLTDASSSGTITNHQHSQRLFPTYKLYLRIPFTQRDAGGTDSTINHYWDLDEQELRCSLSADTDDTPFVTYPEFTMLGSPREIYFGIEGVFSNTTIPYSSEWNPMYTEYPDGDAEAIDSMTPPSFHPLTDCSFYYPGPGNSVWTVEPVYYGIQVSIPTKTILPDGSVRLSSLWQTGPSNEEYWEYDTALSGTDSGVVKRVPYYTDRNGLGTITISAGEHVLALTPSLFVDDDLYYDAYDLPDTLGGSHVNPMYNTTMGEEFFYIFGYPLMRVVRGNQVDGYFIGCSVDCIGCYMETKSPQKTQSRDTELEAFLINLLNQSELINDVGVNQVRYSVQGMQMIAKPYGFNGDDFGDTVTLIDAI